MRNQRDKRDSGIIWWRDGLRRCSGCSGYYDRVAFAPRAGKGARDDGLDRYCRDCRAATHARYYARHRETVIARTLARRALPGGWQRQQSYMRQYDQERAEARRLAAEKADGRALEAREAAMDI